mgnify:CR=1 FL=1
MHKRCDSCETPEYCINTEICLSKSIEMRQEDGGELEEKIDELSVIEIKEPIEFDGEIPPDFFKEIING